MSPVSDDDLPARWLQTVAAALGIDHSGLVDADATAALLDLARDAAHGVIRPAAPA